MPAYKPVLDRFVEKFELNRESGCWEWTASKGSKGYGKFQHHRFGKISCWDAHKVSYDIFWGDVPYGNEVHHRCRNRACVNPNHLEAVTHKNNCQWDERAKDSPNATRTYLIQPTTNSEPVGWKEKWLAERESKRLAKNAKIPGKPFRPLLDRFAEMIQLNLGTECWEWLGVLDKGGYGQIKERLSANVKRKLLAHRASYELFVGDITDDLTVDHRCRNAKCVNPYHLRLMTRSQNSDGGWVKKFREATHCKHGHPFNELNTILRPLKNGKFGRGCRVCRTFGHARTVLLQKLGLLGQDTNTGPVD